LPPPAAWAVGPAIVRSALAAAAAIAHGEHRFGWELSPAIPFAQQICRPVRDHAEQERHYVLDVPVTLAVAEHLDVDILHDIFGIGQAMQAAVCELYELVLGRLDQSVELSNRLGP
jgi:hypothetical protein